MSCVKVLCIFSGGADPAGLSG